MRLLEFFDARVKDGQRLHQFLRYAIDVFGLGRTLVRVADGRRTPEIPTFSVVTSLLMAAVLRVPSLNELEHLLRTQEFQRLLGHRTKRPRNKALFSADTIADVLDTLEVTTLQTALAEIIQKAERNKAFRDDTFGSFISASIDGWEPFCSYERHCPGCLSRQVKRKVREDGHEKLETVTQYYHRFVVAFLIAPKLDLTLAIEPVRPEAMRVAAGEAPGCGDEGELSAALRLIDRVHQLYGCFVDAFALDGLYPCGPVFEKLTEHGYGAFVVTRDDGKDPYRFAESIWRIREQPDQVIQEPQTGEQVSFWRLDGVDALSSFAGSVDMLKAELVRKNGKKSRWVMALVGKAKRASPIVALRIMRARWHIENTAFHQWVTKWNLEHCYRHTPNAITAVMHLWAIAFNLMQLFFYRRLNKPRQGREVSDTIKVCVRLMWLDLGKLDEPVPWELLLHDTA